MDGTIHTYTTERKHRALCGTQSRVDILFQHTFEQRVSVGCEVGGTGEFL